MVVDTFSVGSGGARLTAWTFPAVFLIILDTNLNAKFPSVLFEDIVNLDDILIIKNISFSDLLRSHASPSQISQGGIRSPSTTMNCYFYSQIP